MLANKKTIRQEDVLEALTELEFESFLPRCGAELTREYQPFFNLAVEQLLCAACV